MTAPLAATTLRFEPDAATARPGDGQRVVIADTTWTPGPGDDRVGLRDVAERVLRARDPIVETSRRLDAWAAAADIAGLTTVDDTSFWFYGRLRHWMWLQRRLIWTWIVTACLDDPAIRRISCGRVDDDLIAVARLVAAARGLAFEADGDAEATTESNAGAEGGADDPVGSGPAVAGPAGATRASRSVGPIRRIARGVLRRLRPGRDPGPREALRRRLASLEREPGRLLVILQHAAQRVDAEAGPRMMNVYLDPVADRLRGTRLEPMAVHVTATSEALVDDPQGWRDRILPGAVLRAIGEPGDDRDALASAIADRVAAIDLAVDVDGVDLGPALTAQVAGHLRGSLTWQLRSFTRIRRLLRRLRPAAILLADEYHRQEWLGAARAEGVPTVAIQHGLIYRWHNGYAFPERPASLRLPDRLYVFGRWERRLLTETSVFTADEVRVGGSPRLDLASQRGVASDPGIRDELGIAPTSRLVVVSGSWGPMYRRFQLPIALARIVDRPLPNVHLVVKLHPGEPDEGPYLAVVEGVAAARGFAPPPMTVVRDIDLYRLLAAADAHLGYQSTVLTEAVVTGTRNLLADVAAGVDLLGWVEAGVAVPIRDGGELLAALDDPTTVPTDAARAAFLADHFEPGSAAQRIADELTTWLDEHDA